MYEVCNEERLYIMKTMKSKEGPNLLNAKLKIGTGCPHKARFHLFGWEWVRKLVCYALPLAEVTIAYFFTYACKHGPNPLRTEDAVKAEKGMLYV